MWVKVCGLSKREDVEAAVAAGADAVGFVLAESPRRVSVAEARALGNGVAIHRVLVTVDALPDQLMEWVEQTNASGVQPHGRYAVAAGDAATAGGLLVLHPVTVGSSVDLDPVAKDRIPLLDTFNAVLHGGSGSTFDWSLTDGLDRDFVLAGGLNADNVAQAVDRVHPWGVDASSGLESAPGVKVLERITAFVREAKQA